MTKEEFFKLTGNFTWDFGCHFFIETEKGNFIWSDPAYKGDNAIVRYRGTAQEYFHPNFGRDQGKHIVGEYVDNDAVLDDTVVNYDGTTDCVCRPNDPCMLHADMKDLKKLVTLRCFRMWLEASLGPQGANWSWDGITEIERGQFQSKEIFEEVVKFAQGRPSIISEN